MSDIIGNEIEAAGLIDEYEEETANQQMSEGYLTKETFYMCLMKFEARFDEDSEEIDRIKEEVQEFLIEQKMYPSKNSKRKRRLGHYNFNELKNHEIYRNDVKLVLAICPPMLKGSLRGWDLKYLEKKVNGRNFFRKRNMRFAVIRNEDMRKRERYYEILKLVFEEWKSDQTEHGNLRGAGD